MLPRKRPLLPHPQLHKGLQRLLQIGRILLLRKEIKVLILGGAGTGGQESLRLRRQRRNPPLLIPQKKGRVPRRIHAPARLTQAQHPQLQV